MAEHEYEMCESCKHWNEAEYWCEEFDEGMLPYEFACERFTCERWGEDERAGLG